MAAKTNHRVLKIYKSIFQKYCNQSLQQKTTEVRWKEVTSQIMKEFGMELTYDSRMVTALKDLLSQAITSKSIEEVHNMMSPMKSFCSMLERYRFIKKSHYSQIKGKLQELYRSEQMELLKFNKKLMVSKDKTEFEEEWRECLKNDDVQEFWNSSMEKLNKRTLNIYASIYHLCQRFEKIEKLPVEMQEKLEDVFKDCTGLNQKEAKINRMLQQIAAEKCLENRHDVQQALNKEFDTICKYLEDFFSINHFKDMQASIGKFGSIVNGFATDDADMDITILTNSYTKQGYILQTLFGYLKKKLDPQDYDSSYVGSAQVPVIKLTKKSAVTVKIDIIMNNLCGVINSRYLRVYSEMSRSIKYLGILIKLWAKKEELVANNRFSSYSFILLMIYYLVKKGVVPNILKSSKNTDFGEKMPTVKRIKNEKEEIFQIVNYFDTKAAPLKKKFNIYEHFKGFLKFYENGGEFWEDARGIVALDDNPNKERQDDKIFTIKDPFDEPHNPGRAKLAERDFFMQGLVNSISVIQSQDLQRIKALFVRKGE